MRLRSLLAASLLAAGLSGASATTINLAANGQWAAFDVSDLLADSGGLEWIDIDDGSALSFTFTIAAGDIGTLTVVDGGFAGDSFAVKANNIPLQDTSPGINTYPVSVGLNFDAALADPKYSRRVYSFGAGSYTVTGSLQVSALDDVGGALNSTVGAARLTVSPVPEASTLAMLAAGLSVVGLLVRRGSR